MATFPEARRALLAAVRNHPKLAAWKAQSADDLGFMVLEMWAYMRDCLSFYDKVIADELYVRTAKLASSLRMLVARLGYIPRPAVAAVATLAALGDGRRPVSLLPGVAFRSGGFAGQPPQVFELDGATTVDPSLNQFTLAPVRPGTFGEAYPETSSFLLLELGTAAVKADQLVLLRCGSFCHARRAAQVGEHTGRDGDQYTKVELDSPITLPPTEAVREARLLIPTATGGLWTEGLDVDGYPAMSTYADDILTRIVLDGLYRQIRAGDCVLLSKGGNSIRWFTVSWVYQGYCRAGPETTTTITDAQDNPTARYRVPAPQVPVTVLYLDAVFNDSTREAGGGDEQWDGSDVSDVVLYHGLISAGRVTAEAKTALGRTDPLRIAGGVTLPPGLRMPSRFLLEDRSESGLLVTGALDTETGALLLDPTVAWTDPLAAPVRLYGNVVAASRGETVRGEVLGSGDASVANQSFTLKKGPLTYVPSPAADNEQGVASTLQIRVDGIAWTEVPSFFAAREHSRVYVVRRTDEGATAVTFGDGVLGSRLPTGVDNVVADYRYGAGAASPPCGSITQLAKPQPGLRSVRNPVPAAGGSDAAAAGTMRTSAPQSALLLGRAVSIQDMEAAVAGMGGARAVQAEWRWCQGGQRPGIHVSYIGDKGLESRLSRLLRGLTDPATPITVSAATPVTRQLSLEVVVNRSYSDHAVRGAVREALFDPDSGPLAPEVMGIGRPLFRSRILGAVTSVPGAESVSKLDIDGRPFSAFLITPEAGHYFEFEREAALTSVWAVSHG
jgi:hypothetical protein